MEENFYTECYCELVITSYETEVEDITTSLNIIPSRFFRKGERVRSKHSRSAIIKPYNLWAITTKDNVKKDDLKSHLLYLKSLLKDKIESLEFFKVTGNNEVSLWIWIETEDAGIGFDLLQEDLYFFNQILNRIHFTIITNKLIDKNSTL